MTKGSKAVDYTDLKPRILVMGVGGAGGNAINNMIAAGLIGVEFIAANTDAQALLASSAQTHVQLGANLTEGLGAGSKPEIGEAAAEEAAEDIRQRISGAHMLFIAAGMGGGTGTGATSVIARIARDLGILTVAVVTKPFQFEGSRRMRTAEAGIAELKDNVDTLIVIPNQNLFRIANDRTTFAEAFVLADQVLYSGIACIVDLIVKEGLINLDLADVKTVLTGMGTAMMGTGEASGDRRAVVAAEEAISNPLLDDVTLKGARGLLVSIIGGHDLTLFEVDEAATRVRQEVDPEANIIVGATFDESLGDRVRVSIVASGMARRGMQPGGGPVKAGQGRDMAPPPLPGDVGLARGQGDGEWRHRLAEALVPSAGPSSRFDGPMVGAGAARPAAPAAKGPSGDGDLGQQIAQMRAAQAGTPPESVYGERPAGGAQHPVAGGHGVPDIGAFPDVGKRAWQAAYGDGAMPAQAVPQTAHGSPVARHPADPNQTRGGLFQRLSGVGRRRA